MSIGTTKTGNWYVQYRVPGLPSPRKEYFGKGSLGYATATARQQEIKDGNVVTVAALAGRQVYLDELAQLYLNYLTVVKGQKEWVRHFASLTNTHFLPLLCHAPVNALTLNDIVNVAKLFLDKSVCTQNRYLDYLHMLFRFGVAQGLTNKDPMQGWKKLKEPKRNVKLTVEDLQKIWSHSPAHLQWIIEVQWELGTRPGPSELFSIQWSDVDFERNIIHIRGTKTKTSNRLIPISTNFKERLLVKRAESTTNYVVEYKGKPITSCRKAFKSALESAQISYPARLYDIRHLFASTILANGGDLKAVSKLLGHSTTRMTVDTYYHELKGEKERALAVKPRLL